MKWNPEITPRSLKRVALVLALAGGLGYLVLFSYLPFLQELGDTEILASQAELQRDTQIVANRQVEQIQAEAGALRSEIRSLHRGVYTDLRQQDVILLLDGLARDTGVELGNLGFRRPATEARARSAEVVEATGTFFSDLESRTAPDLDRLAAITEDLPEGILPLDELSVDLVITGGYDRCMQFIQTIENLPHSVLVTEYSMAPDLGGSPGDIEAFINLWFYALPNVLREDQRIVRVIPHEYETRADPFAPRWR